MAIVYQDLLHPASTLAAIVEAASSEDLESIRIAAAYTTRAGCRLLCERLETALGANRWSEVEKTLVTSLDFGHTEPAALEYLRGLPASHVRIAHLSGSAGDYPINPQVNFHPKLYIFSTATGRRLVVGSSNLSRRALTLNTECCAQLDLTAGPDIEGVDRAWEEIRASSDELTDDILRAYTAARPQPRQVESSDESDSAPDGPLEDPPVFRHAVEDRSLDLADFESLWVEAGSMSSSASHAQLELPRLACRFFGYDFDDYDADHHTIGIPTLSLGDDSWERPLTWHGNNGMERINLPTENMSGLIYPDRTVMFRRREGRFDLQVAPMDGLRAESWLNESRGAGNVFVVGSVSERLCGLI